MRAIPDTRENRPNDLEVPMSLQDSQAESLEDAPGDATSGAGEVTGLSPTRLALRRFRKDKLSMASFVVVALVILCGIAAPFLVKFGVLDPFHSHQNLLNTNLGSVPKGSFGGISWHHPLGVEPGGGRDAMSRFWYGVTFSMAIALSATILTVTIGTVLGIVAGFSGGWVDWLIGRIIDLTMSFPQTLMLLALSSLGVALLAKYLPGSEGSPFINGLYVVLVLSLFGWPSVARLLRGQVLTIREREFIDAARLFGAPRRRIYFKEILPNLWAPLLVQATLILPLYVSAEAALSFLGVGISPPTPTLGNVLTDSIQYIYADFTYFFIPAFLIAVIVISFNLFGDGLGDALDPKSDR